MPSNHPPFSPFLEKLTKHTILGQEAESTVRALPHRLAEVEGGKYIVRDGDRTEHCCFLISGYVHRSRHTRDGRRQILSVHMRGDAIDLRNSMLGLADHNVQALTSCEVAYVPQHALLAAATAHPALGQAFWRQTLIEASIAYEWMLSIGRRSARQRIIHLICEITLLQRAAGLAQDLEDNWPFTQEQIADMVGLTPVHVNRTIQCLRNERLIGLAKHTLSIPDWAALKTAASFSSAYLHQGDIAA